MQLGNPSRPLSTQNPTIDSLLPSEEEEFDQGVGSLDIIIHPTPSHSITDHQS